MPTPFKSLDPFGLLYPLSYYRYSYNWYNVYSECEDHVEAMYEFIESTLADAETAGEKVGSHPHCSIQNR